MDSVAKRDPEDSAKIKAIEEKLLANPEIAKLIDELKVVLAIYPLDDLDDRRAGYSCMERANRVLSLQPTLEYFHGNTHVILFASKCLILFD